ncbi:MAG: UDP-N-acetylmuramoyl-tripeptide--D-alanyl-D-alanine ligase [Paramuribaculum sp.]|nr:UDP-N-acetylmuramoyl-tripeptide--D-alanyl-D-alanine ligase [Paramuribaculum sp.]
MTVIFIVYLIILLLALQNLVCELKRDLMMMQQNSYRLERYSKWLKTSGDTTSWSRLSALCVFFLSMVGFSDMNWGMGFIAAWAGGNVIYLMSRKYKKPLVWTPRSKRIYTVAAILCIIVVGAAVLLFGKDELSRLFAATVASFGCYCGSHIIIMSAVWLLEPVERRINRGYYRDAERILRSMPDLKIIGITGSYGKTSTKHYLHRILSESFQTAMTPGSFNTTLGVIRTVREYLKPYDKVFIVEMGAKNIGDIKEICDLVHPTVGIVTAVGEQHLESFKSIENVQRTKFELVDSLPADGLAVINNDFPKIADREVSNCNCIRYAVTDTAGAQWIAQDIEYSDRGTSFTAKGPDTEIRLTTRLVGDCNISNLLACVAVAVNLGVPEDKIRYAVSRIEQVEHRLNLKRTPAGITIIDDAFNSNPTGSAMALDVLSRMKGGRRIIITPGMIELGDRTEELNRKFGRKIAECADIAIVVGHYNRDAIVDGIRSGAMPEQAILTADSFAQAQVLLQGFVKAGDTVLYENDLPDTFK